MTCALTPNKPLKSSERIARYQRRIQTTSCSLGLCVRTKITAATRLKSSSLATLKLGFRHPSLLDLHRYIVADLAFDPQRSRHSLAALAARGQTVHELSAFSLSFPYHFCFVAETTPITVRSVLLIFPSRNDILCSELVLTRACDGPQNRIGPRDDEVTVSRHTPKVICLTNFPGLKLPILAC